MLPVLGSRASLATPRHGTDARTYTHACVHMYGTSRTPQRAAGSEAAGGRLPCPALPFPPFVISISISISTAYGRPRPSRPRAPHASRLASLLPVARVDHEPRDLLEPGPVALVEAAEGEAVEVQHAQGDLPLALPLPLLPAVLPCRGPTTTGGREAEDERADDLAARLAVARDVARVRVDVGHEHGAAREERGGAHAAGAPRRDVDQLAGGLAAEGPEEELLRRLGSGGGGGGGVRTRTQRAG